MIFISPSGLLPGLILLKIDQLRFQRVEERFHQSIVTAMASGTHTRDKTVPVQQIPKSITGILSPPIEMQYQTPVSRIPSSLS